jgi:hypothetical protein
MTTKELQKQFDTLSARYVSKSETHSKRFSATVNESAYQDSCTELSRIYEEMEKLSLMLDIPISKQF